MKLYKCTLTLPYVTLLCM